MARGGRASREDDRRLSAVLLDLHQMGRLTTPDVFHAHALKLLGSLIPFDRAWWGRGSQQPPAVLQAHFDRVSAGIIDDYPAIAEHDVFRDAMIRTPGSPVMMSDLLDGDDYRRSPLYLHYGKKHRVEHALGTVQFEPLTALYEFVTVWRTRADKPFSERDRRFKELVMPHLCEAASANRQAFANELSASTRARPWLLCDGKGVISEIHPRMVHRLRASFADWACARVPDALAGVFDAGIVRCADGLAVEARRSGEQWVISLLEESQLATLTTRERAVATAYADGNTYSQIAAATGRAPGTIRNQLASAYRKLGIASKTELVRLLAGQDAAAGDSPRTG